MRTVPWNLEDLNTDERMTKLDSVFLKEEKDCQYDAYMEFDQITRENGVSMVDYIMEFERRTSFKMELPDSVLPFKQDKQLALTACPSLSFVNMKSTLKRMFGSNLPQRSARGLGMSGDAADSAYYTRFTCKRESRSSLQTWLKYNSYGTNPLDRHERRTRCAVCQSTYHWAKDCSRKKIDRS